VRITATITDKGQITIPRAIRERLRGKIVEFVVTDESIELRNVPSFAGGLAAYADGYTPLEEVRELTWGKGPYASKE
jgi:AbrB family looped-hinge helix DNA binding protein